MSEENGEYPRPIEIVDSPILDGDFPVRKLLVYRGVMIMAYKIGMEFLSAMLSFAAFIPTDHNSSFHLLDMLVMPSNYQ